MITIEDIVPTARLRYAPLPCPIACAINQLHRLMTWLEAFKECFGHRAQVLALRRYVQGLLSDSDRKSMEAMLARVTEPGSYQAFQHFITDAPWSADRVWRRLRAVLPEREGLLIFDATTFLKQGHALGRRRAPVLWLAAARSPTAKSPSPPRCGVARAPICSAPRCICRRNGSRTLPRPQARDSRGGALPTEVAPRPDAAPAGARERVHDYRRLGRCGIWRQPHISWPCCIDCGCRMRSASRRISPPFSGRRACRPPALGAGAAPSGTWRLASRRARFAELPSPTARLRWRRLRWRNRRGARQWTADCAAIRVTPALDQRHPRFSPEIWLLAERDVGPRSTTRFYYVNLPPTASAVAARAIGPSPLGRSSSSIKNSKPSSV